MVPGPVLTLPGRPFRGYRATARPAPAGRPPGAVPRCTGGPHDDDTSTPTAAPAARPPRPRRPAQSGAGAGGRPPPRSARERLSWPSWPSCPLLVVQAGRGHLGHQDLPLPRPGALPVPGGLHVEPDGGPGHGHPRVHRLPAAHGALLLALLGPARPRLGGPAAVAGGDPLRRRGRHPVTCAGCSACAGPGRLVAALAFMLSPVLPPVRRAASRSSCCPGPGCRGWSPSPRWPCGGAAGATRPCSPWWWPWSAGSTPAPIIYVGVAPVLWLVYAVLVEREATWRRRLAAACKIGAASPWWSACGGSSACRSRAAYGVNVLKYTETVPSTSQTSSASEVIRGLGYWYFYGGDRLGPWTDSAVLYTQQLWLIALSYLVPVLAFAGGRVRPVAPPRLLRPAGRGRGGPVGRGPPLRPPTPLGGVLKHFMTDTTAGLAMRSTDRATPLVVLGLAMLLGQRRDRACGGAARGRPGHRRGGGAAWWSPTTRRCSTGTPRWPPSFFTQPAALPAYERQAVAHLNATHPGTRVLAIPGDDFAAYRWGDTVDTPQAAFLDPALRHPRAADHGVDGHRRHPLRHRRAHPGGHRALERPGPHGPAAQRRRRPGRERPAYEHYGIPQPAVLFPAAPAHPGRALGPGRLRPAGAQRLGHLHPRTSRTWRRRPTPPRPRPSSPTRWTTPARSPGPSRTRGR